MLDLIINALHYVSISFLLVILMILLKGYLFELRVRIAVFFILSLISFLLLSVDVGFHFSIYFRLILFLGVSCLTFSYWMLSLSMFDDHFEFSTSYVIILIIKTIVSFAAIYTYDINYQEYNLRWLKQDGKNILHFLIPLLFSFGFIFASVLQTYLGEKDDLIESRIALRKFHILISGLIIAGITFTYFFVQTDLTAKIVDLVSISLITGGIFFAIIILLDLKEGLIERPKIQEIKQQSPIDPQLLKSLTNAFDNEKVYQEDVITIRKLAEHLGEQEYKIRRLINQELGFKNFNDFINQYRVKDACEDLKNPEKKDIPVIRIAMDVGFQSLAPFNKAFKDHTGMTPTEYRKKELIV